MLGPILGVAVVAALSLACESAQHLAASADGGTMVPEASGATPIGDASDAMAEDAQCVVDAGAAAPAALGEPCVPETESDPSFAGFPIAEIFISAGFAGCASRVCLVDHFRGRVTCPYGQDMNGRGPGGTLGCLAPGSCEPVRPNPPINGGTVAPQCTDRRSAQTVYCSCRCANGSGSVDDAGPYCTCPNGMTCTLLIAGGIGGLAGGAYCVKTDAPYDRADACAVACNPTTAPCP
jgi:hypothetical protein